MRERPRSPRSTRARTDPASRDLPGRGRRCKVLSADTAPACSCRPPPRVVVVLVVDHARRRGSATRFPLRLLHGPGRFAGAALIIVARCATIAAFAGWHEPESERSSAIVHAPAAACGPDPGVEPDDELDPARSPYYYDEYALSSY